MDDVITINADLETFSLIQKLLKFIGSDVVIEVPIKDIQTDNIWIHLYGKKYIINKI